MVLKQTRAHRWMGDKLSQMERELNDKQQEQQALDMQLRQTQDDGAPSRAPAAAASCARARRGLRASQTARTLQLETTKQAEARDALGTRH